MLSTRARVRLVVLNHQGGEHVVRCVRHLVELDWPVDSLDLVVVDNASTDGSPEALAAQFPTVRILRRQVNGGFPANNDALRDLRGVDYVGLVNNDAFVEPSYLGPLVDALDSDPGVGAACPLILFESRYVDLHLSTTAQRPGRGDPRALGVRLSGLRVQGRDRWRRMLVASGGHGAEHGQAGPYEWTGAEATLRIPVERDRPVPPSARLQVCALSPRRLTVTSGDGTRVEHVVGSSPDWIDVPLGGDPYDVVNNAGSLLLDGGYGADRGFGSPLGPELERPCEVWAWCGGAVLLRPSYLEDVGLFDERFFLYYEDTDLSWRGQARGWRYRYVPDAVVRHLHAATSVEGSARFAYFTERNRLLMLARNAPSRMVLDEVGRFVGETYDAARRDVAGAIANGRRPNPVPVLRRLRALAGATAAAPHVLATRPGLRSARRRGDAEVLAHAEALRGA